MSRFLLCWRGLAMQDAFHLTSARKNLGRHLALFLLAVILAIILGFTNQIQAEPVSDQDGDGLSDEQEDYLGKNFVPIIYAGGAESCGPLWDKGDWCFDGVPGRPHQRGYIAYDVVDLGFSGLVAIEYTLFLDRDCGFFATHFFDNEGFTILLQECPSCQFDYRVLSVETCGHHKTSWETWDRLYPHEVETWVQNGRRLLIAEGTHAFYVHHGVCERQHGGTESCGYQIPINGRCEIGPYIKGCPCDDDSLTNQYKPKCLTDYIRYPDCWAQRLAYNGRYGGFPPRCVPFDKNIVIDAEKKQIPPWIPIEVSLPPNLAYVDLFEKPGYRADGNHTGPDERENFGDALVDANMPLRLINFPFGPWWEQFYDPGYQFRELAPDGKFGLLRTVFKYNYWTKDEDISFQDDIESFRLHGLPGTILVLYNYGQSNYNYYLHEKRAYSIHSNSRLREVRDLGDLNGKVDFVSWGFGPMADAGDNRYIYCQNKVTLDASGSFKYVPDQATLERVFGLKDIDWEFKWYDLSGGGFLDSGVMLETNLSYGVHLIKLEVSGTMIPYPDDPSQSYHARVSDQCRITVGITSPQNVNVISLCDEVEIYWDTVAYASGYKVYRDGQFLKDVGRNAFCIDTVSGEHEYYVSSFDIQGYECASAPVTGVGKKCVETAALQRYFVNQNYPNPFNTSTRLSYYLSKAGNVKIVIYNTLGQKVRTLVDKLQESGHHFADWDGTDDRGIFVASGLYFYQLQTDDFCTRKKMVLVK